jgi:hypothetical protein
MSFEDGRTPYYDKEGISMPIDSSLAKRASWADCFDDAFFSLVIFGFLGCGVG